MKRVFGENALDRGLLKLAVLAFSRSKGLEYEAAHQKLSNFSKKIDHFTAGFDSDGAGFRGDDSPTVEGELDSMFDEGGRP